VLHGRVVTFGSSTPSTVTPTASDSCSLLVVKIWFRIDWRAVYDGSFMYVSTITLPGLTTTSILSVGNDSMFATPLM
jgi:hypothetical protein